MESKTLESRLILVCARVLPSPDAAARIRQILGQGIDWTLLVREALDHGLAGLVGRTLDLVAPDMVPEDILDALRMHIDHTRKRNNALFAEIVAVIEALANHTVVAIPFLGPALTIKAHSDLGFRVFKDLDFLIRETDIGTTLPILRLLGYERKERLSGAQIDLIRWLQGHEIIFKKSLGIGVGLRTRLAPVTMGLNIDYAGLWARVQLATLNRRSIMTLAPEDDFLLLAIYGGKELWKCMGLACDVAAFIVSHPNLDWATLLDRAKAQGCFRMALLATALACRYFGVAVPDALAAAERNDPTIEPMVERIVARWQAGKPVGLSHKRISMDRLRLQDGAAPAIRYMARTLLLPKPYHVARIRLPRWLTFQLTYIPIKVLLDIVIRPLARVYRNVLAGIEDLQNVVASHQLLAVLVASTETRASLTRHQEARAQANRALADDVNNAGAWFSLGKALTGLKRYEEAIVCYDKALAIVPDSTAIWKHRGAAIRDSKAVPFDSEGEQTLDTQDANAWARRAGFFLASQRFCEAAAASDRALAINPKHLVATRIGIRSRMSACDWHSREDDNRRITEGLRSGLHIITPFNHRTICPSEAENLVAARLFWKGFPQLKPLWHGERYRHDRIRVAYISAELHDHPLAIQTVGVFENHDRKLFETSAISLGPINQSKLRKRIEAAFDRFIDAGAMSDTKIATMLRETEIDIAMDLNGHAGEGRPEILGHRPAPVQVNGLAYTGTMAAPFFDYIVADRTVIPVDQACYYMEKIAYLPHSYQCNDSRRDLPQHVPLRVDAGLPETGFVYCCFNNNHKIIPQIFDIWMRLLEACPGSILWLLGDNPYAMYNLRREASERGVAPERLVFAPRMLIDDHLARHSLADLFLDTLPYNAHATASDALWAGLPLLTCIGNTFPGRVAASLLYAIGLPELVTKSLAEYEELALALAQDPARLAAIKAKLLRNRETKPLFDTARYTRDLESAYLTMWERQQAGLTPASFAVGSAL